MSDRVTARDIETQEFAGRFRGYDRDEVRMFLRSVAGEVERLTLENGRLLEELGAERARLESLREREAALQDTLVSARQMVRETEERARKEADLVLRQARAQSDEMLGEARETLRRLESEISSTAAERESFEQRLRGTIEQHLALLDMRRKARGPRESSVVRVMPAVGSEAG